MAGTVKKNEDGVSLTRMGSFRKRPLEVSESGESMTSRSKYDKVPPIDGEEKDISLPPRHPVGTNSLLDEIELHFQRSLSKGKTWKSMDDERSPETLSPSERRSVSDVHIQHTSKAKPKLFSEGENVCTNPEKPSLMSSATCPMKNVVPISVSVSTANSSAIIEERTVAENALVDTAMRPANTEVTLRDRVPPVSPVVMAKQTHEVPVMTTPVSSKEDNVVPSRRLNSSERSPTSKVYIPATTQSGGPVHLISFARHCSSVSHPPVNGLTTSGAGNNGSLSIVSVSQAPRVVVSNPVRTESSKEGASVIYACRNSSSSTSPKGGPVSSPVMLVPASHGGVGSALMMQPQPFILVHPSEIQQTAQFVTPSTVYPGAGAQIIPNVITNAGNGSGYILLSSNPAVSNSVHQVSSTGFGVSQAGVTVPAIVPTTSQQLLMTSPKKTVNIFNSAKVSCDSASPKDNTHSDIDVMPASVEDHFAKALGDQWSKLNPSSGVTVSPSHNTLVS